MPSSRGHQRPLLLDTHVWIWYVEGASDLLSAGKVELINRHAARASLYLSVISVWELATLEAKEKIRLTRSLDAWLNVALTISGLQLVDLSPKIAVNSTRLPEAPHGDPADRIIMATAREAAATLLTVDAMILRYASRGHVNALDASS